MLEISRESLTQRRQCIEEFGGDTLDRIVLKGRCLACEEEWESSALVATTGYGFESMRQLRELVERVATDSQEELSCPTCDEPDAGLERVYYLAYSAALGVDLAVELVSSDERWLISCYLIGDKVERVSVADERLPDVYRESLLRAAASASELGGSPELAKTLLERCRDTFGACPRGLYLLAAIHRELGEFDEAVEALTEMLDDPKECQKSLFEIGVTHFAALRKGEDQLVEAFTAFSTVLELDEEHAPAHLYLGNIYLGLGRFEESLSHFESALEVDAKMMEAHFNAGVALSKLEDPARALPHFERAHELSPEDADAARRLGETLQALGRDAEGRGFLEMADLLDAEWI